MDVDDNDDMDDDVDDDVDTFELVALVAVNCNGLTSKL